MKMRCYALFDRKSLAYNMPYYAVTDGQAVRTLSDAVADPQSMFSRHPDDFVLYCIGEFDDQKGALSPFSPLIHVIDAVSLVQALRSEKPFPDNVVDMKETV